MHAMGQPLSDLLHRPARRENTLNAVIASNMVVKCQSLHCHVLGIFSSAVMLFLGAERLAPRQLHPSLSAQAQRPFSSTYLGWNFSSALLYVKQLPQ